MLKQFRVVVTVFVTLLMLSNGAYATPVTGLYRATVIVPNQGAAERKAGLAEAMAAVLVKASGNRKAAARAGAGLRDADKYVEQYTYGSRGGQTTMSVTFDKRSMNKFMDEKRITIWGEERPDTLLWFAVQDEQALIGATTPGETALKLRQALRRHNDRRGINISLPPLKGAGVDYSTVWSGQWTTVNKATRKANVYAALSGRATREGNSWVIRWRHQVRGGKARTWTSNATNLQVAVKQMTDKLADRYARAFTAQPAGGARGESRLTIYGVDDFAKYAKLMNYLRSLTMLRTMTIATVASDEVVVDVTLNGSEAALRRTIGIGGKLSGSQRRDFVDPELLDAENGAVTPERHSLYFKMR